MAFMNMPLGLNVPGVIAATKLGMRVRFANSQLLMRYQPDDGDCHLPITFNVKGVFTRRGTQAISTEFWKVEDVGGDSDTRLVKLTFDGKRFSKDLESSKAKKSSEPLRRLYEALLDQHTIQLELALDKKNFAALFLKLDSQMR